MGCGASKQKYAEATGDEAKPEVAPTADAAAEPPADPQVAEAAADPAPAAEPAAETAPGETTIVATLSEEQAAELRESFSHMDANGDGTVTKDELKQLLEGLGESTTPEVVDEMMKLADKNNDGVVDFEEFVKAATSGEM
jgi:hypothetical protein